MMMMMIMIVNRSKVLNMCQAFFFFFFLFLFYLFFGCVGSSLLHAGFLQLQRVGATLPCGAWASHCGGFSCCRARALGTQASVVAACGLSSCSTRALERTGFSSCCTWALGHMGFSSCGMRAQQLWLAGSRAQAQQLWCTGLTAPRHVEFSWTRDQTHVPCTGRRILNHCATREVPKHFSKH